MRADSRFYSHLLKLLVILQLLAVKGTLCSWPSCTWGLCLLVLGYGKAVFILVTEECVCGGGQTETMAHGPMGWLYIDVEPCCKQTSRVER